MGHEPLAKLDEGLSSLDLGTNLSHAGLDPALGVHFVGAFLEDLDRPGQRAQFVFSVGVRHLRFEFAAGEGEHGGRDFRQWHGDAPPDDQAACDGASHADEKKRKMENQLVISLVAELGGIGFGGLAPGIKNA